MKKTRQQIIDLYNKEVKEDNIIKEINEELLIIRHNKLNNIVIDNKD